MKTYSFNSGCGQFTFYVTTRFVEKYGYVEAEVYELMNRYNLKEYLHNEEGPAIIDNHSGNVQYWLEGKKADRETAAKIEHDAKFNSDFDKMLNNDDIIKENV